MAGRCSLFAPKIARAISQFFSGGRKVEFANNKSSKAGNSSTRNSIYYFVNGVPPPLSPVF